MVRVGVLYYQEKKMDANELIAELKKQNRQKRIQDIENIQRGQVIPFEVLQQSHWVGCNPSNASYGPKLHNRMNWIENYFQKERNEKVVCKQSDYGIELLYGQSAVDYLREREQQTKRLLIRYGDKLTTHINKNELTETQRRCLESAQLASAKLKHAIYLVENPLVVRDLSKPQPVPQSVGIGG